MKPHPERGYSLRRRLLWLIVGGSTALWLASVCIMAAIAWRETNDVFDDALKESGYLVMAATTDWNARGLPSQAPAAKTSRKLEIHYQIVADGKVVQRTSGAPVQPFVSMLARQPGFADIMIGARKWRVFFVSSADQRFAVEVGQEYRHRLDILRELAEHLAAPMLAMLALLAAASWFAIGKIIRPIATTALAITGKTRDDLSLLGTDNQPSELLPIVDALNGMLARLDAALQAERRFTADAAHELRTPLAGVHMHVQLMQRQHPALVIPFQKLRADIERSTALVDSLLTLARLDPMARDGFARAQTALQPLLEEIVRTHTDTANRRGIELRVRCRMDHICVNADMMGIILRNLIDNALRYCSPGNVVEVSASWNEGTARIAVRDNGPGVDAADRARLSERFFRVLGSRQNGNGLGLSIVKRIVELHGATLSFAVGLDQCGLAVVIDFPLAVTDAARRQAHASA